MAGALVFCEGADKYGPAGSLNVTNLLAGEWLSSTGTLAIAASLSAYGYALSMTSINAATQCNLTSVPFRTTLGRVAGTFRINSLYTGNLFGGIQLKNGVNTCFSLQWAFQAARIELRVGATTGQTTGTLLNSGGSLSAGSTHDVSYDITIGPSAAYTVWLDGVLLFSGTGNTGNGQTVCDRIFPFITSVAAGGATQIIDDITVYDPTQPGYDSTVLTSNPLVLTKFGNADAQKVFTNDGDVIIPAGLLDGTGVCRSTATVSAPGANFIFLLKCTPSVSRTLNSISVIPGATSATAKLKAVCYADSAGSPGALLSDGVEVVGLNSGVVLTSNLATPVSLTAGTPVWIGAYTDTSVSLYLYDTSSQGISKALTYTSGAPNPAGSGFATGRSTWLLWGNCTGSTVNYLAIGRNPPLGTVASQIHSANVGDEELYSFPALDFTPDKIYGGAVKGLVGKSDSGSRGVSFNHKSGSSDSTGSSANQALSTSKQWMGSYFDTDPATGLPFTPSDVNAAKSGVSVAS